MNDEVLKYVEIFTNAGLNVLPIKTGTKRPALDSWDIYKTERKSTPEEHTKWFNVNHPVGIGVVCGKTSGNLLILDFDSEVRYAEFMAKVAKNSLINPIITKTWKVRSGGGHGYHIYLRLKEDFLKGIKHQDNLDIIYQGGQACAPPTIHPDTKQQYSFIDGSGPGDTGIAVIEDESTFSIIIGMLTPTEEEQKKKLMLEIVEIVRPYYLDGYRNNIIFAITGWFKKSKVAKKYAKAFLDGIAPSDDKAANVLEERYKHEDKDDDSLAGYKKLEELLDTIAKSNAILGLNPQTTMKNLANVVDKVGYKRDSYSNNGNSEIMECTDLVMSKHRFITQHKYFYVYSPENGCYKDEGAEIIRRMLRARDLAQAQKKVGEVVSKVQDISYNSDIVMRSALSGCLLNLSNGVLDLDNGELHEHTPDGHFLSTMPIPYDPNAECVDILKFLVDITYPDPEAFITLIEEVAYVLVEDCRFQKGFLHVGGGSNGKDKYADILRSLFGTSNMSTVSIGQILNDKFLVSKLRGKMLNIGSEVDVVKEEDGKDIVQKLISGDIFTCDEKFKEPFDFPNKAKLISNANDLPRVTIDYPWARRWKITEFGNKFVNETEWNEAKKDGWLECKLLGKDALKREIGGREHYIFRRNPEIAKKITSTEQLQGFLNLCLAVRGHLLAKGFTFEDSSYNTSYKYAVRSGDGAWLFRYECLEKAGDTDKIGFKELYAAYVRYCSGLGMTPSNDVWFARGLAKYNDFGYREEQERVESGWVTYYYGIRFKEPVKRCSMYSEYFSIINTIFSTILLYTKNTFNNKEILTILTNSKIILEKSAETLHLIEKYSIPQQNINHTPTPIAEPQQDKERKSINFNIHIVIGGLERMWLDFGNFVTEAQFKTAFPGYTENQYNLMIHQLLEMDIIYYSPTTGKYARKSQSEDRDE